jgi:hypothetical protein
MALVMTDDDHDGCNDHIPAFPKHKGLQIMLEYSFSFSFFFFLKE